MTKRTFLISLFGASGAFAIAKQTGLLNASKLMHATETVPAAEVIVRLLDAKGDLTEPLAVPKVVKSERAWRAQLTDEQYRVARGEGTERAFCGIFHDNHKQGVYACIGCGLPLFRSDAKFESGTGWPSFFQPVAAENVSDTADESYGMLRTEIHCSRCDSHLGHVFRDGPKPSGLRYCINSAALGFHESGVRAAREKVVFGAGCFWGVEAAFARAKGVTHTRVGYSGGILKNPTYEDVCSHATGHAEVVEVEFDSAQTSLGALLDVFWNMHDPTSTRSVGPDHGSQYRSAIFFNAPGQEAEARLSAIRLEKSGKFSRPVATEIALAAPFYAAEDYHQKYYAKHSIESCRIP